MDKRSEKHAKKKITLETKIPWIIAMLGIIVTLSIGLYNNHYTKFKDQLNDKEILSIKLISLSHDDQVLYKKFPAKELGGSLIQESYDVIISNNSKRKVSLLSHNIELRDSQAVYFSGMVNGVILGDKDLEYPLVLADGESVKLRLKLNNVIPSEVDEIIRKKYSYGSTVNFDELQFYLFSQGYDIYGNSMKMTTYEGGSVIVESLDVPVYPSYEVSFRTARGNVFSQKINYMDLSK